MTAIQPRYRCYWYALLMVQLVCISRVNALLDPGLAPASELYAEVERVPQSLTDDFVKLELQKQEGGPLEKSNALFAA